MKDTNIEVEIKIKEKLVNEEGLKNFFLKKVSDRTRTVLIFQEVIKIIVSIYLKLTFTESKDSYYKKGERDRSRMNLLFKDLKKLKEAIHDATDINIRKYPEDTFPPFQEELKSLLKPFNEMTLELMEVSRKN
ncbi:hypothetical protein F7734_59595 [Scytonema sp. UIC 10036]|uniref:hypothetical protein n=1 Tax=Scytonema sp. UIC 10036 TaxID=2304196 RepID=UPI0012DA5BE8|nr:hypothetical protein [Scytonema sp. UIC 10036]MUH01741.1 hypothetical protein [Scytonema sp. UIC 10036]